MIQPGFSPEIRLLLASAPYPLQDEQVARLQASCRQELDWQVFTALCERHGLVPTVYRNLSTHAAGLVPPAVLARLLDLAGINRQRVLKALGAVSQIAGWFAQDGLPVCALKGPLLAQRLFGDASLRMSTDLDLLIYPESLLKAEAVLLGHGIQRVFPAVPLTPRQLQVFRQEWYHNSFVTPEGRVVIELHWAIAAPGLIAPEFVRQMMDRSRPLAGSGSSLNILSEADLPVYLLVHGSKHSWVRLKWLVDFVASMRTAAAGDWQAIQTRMAELGLLRSLGQAVLLAQWLFAVPIPEAVPQSLVQDPATHKLARHSLRAIQDSGYRGSELGKQQRLKYTLYAMQLKRGFRYKWGTLRKLWTVAYDWQDVPLPDSLFFLYGLLRPFLWLRRVYRHRWKSRMAAAPTTQKLKNPRQ